MQKTIIAISFITLLNLTFCSCKNAAESNTAVAVDSTKTQEAQAPQKNNDFIQPPDTDYTGDYVDKYKNGIIKFTGFFRFGQRHGQWMAFYINGEKWSECFYDKGLKHGSSIVYFPNGKPQYTGWYKNDMKDSVWTFYDTLAKVIDVKYFKNDEEVEKPKAKPHL